jgi:GNAT superfamily N-acetyltransferase
MSTHWHTCDNERMVDVRRATAADSTRVAATLASAFAVDPVCCWMCGQDDTQRRMTPFWTSLAKTGLAKPDHVIYVADDLSGAAVWRGIDKWKVPTSEVLRTAPAILRSLRSRAPLTLGLLSAMEKVHPTEPHYYLEFLGTRGDMQGKGVGSAVIAPILERCDREGVAAYLESSNRKNVPFYARHGFVETGEISAPRGGPKLTAMRREPRAA